MSRLQSILGALREEAARLGEQAGPGAGDLDLSRLDDDELDRLDVLVRQLYRTTGNAPRLGSGAHYPGHNAEADDWNCACKICGLPAKPKPLSEAEGEELAGLLEQARVPERWEGEG